MTMITHNEAVQTLREIHLETRFGHTAGVLVEWLINNARDAERDRCVIIIQQYIGWERDRARQCQSDVGNRSAEHTIRANLLANVIGKILASPKEPTVTPSQISPSAEAMQPFAS